MNDPILTALVRRFADLREQAGRAMREHPGDPRGLMEAGKAYRMMGDYPLMCAAFKRVTELAPNNWEAWLELGFAQEYTGDSASAAESYRRCIPLTPGTGFQALHALVQVEKQTVEKNRIAELEQLFALPDGPGWQTLHLGHALAKTYEDLGDHEKSLFWLTRAKERRRARFPYDRENEAGAVEAAIASFERVASAPSGHDSIEPIFIAGLARSGTTLVDRILSSHPDVKSVGEIGNFGQIFLHLSKSPTQWLLHRNTFLCAANVDYEKQGRLYIESTRPLSGDTPRFIDKAPSNYLLAPMILRALPNARVIVMRRNPLDAVLSNYKQLFPVEDRYYDYVYGLDSTARKVVMFERVIRHWEQVLPANRFRVVQYEDLVTNQEKATRELLAFAGLSWDDRCLAFHENKAAVGTPSAAQVRQPMYQTAVGRARRYGALLDPARDVLAAAGLPVE